MKFICRKDSLLEAVNNVGRAVSGKSIHPSLEGIYLKAGSNSLFLAGYDLELGITTQIEADVQEPGSIVLSAKLFAEIISKLPSDEVDVRVDEKLNVYIESGQSNFQILGISSSEYPELPSVDDGTGITLPQNILLSMIRQTIFAVAKTDNRPIHKGILFEIEKGVLRLVAVDGSRLALRSEKIDNNDDMSFVIPGKTLNEVTKLLQDEDTPVSLAIGRRHVVMEINGYAVISRLLEGEFLAYNKTIPTEASTTIRLKTKDMIDAVERASLVINDYVKSPMVCQFTEDKVRISCFTSMGSVNDEFAAKIEGKTEEMGFNSRLLLDALRNCECDEIRIEINGSLSPLKILPVNKDDIDNFLFLVLPVRLKK